MIRINEVIIVEGKYDRNRLSQIVDADIVETSGFGIFNDCQLRNYISRIAEKKGIVILTDSDSSGFKIRNYIKSFVPACFIKNAYIPDIYGKEKRKREYSKERKIGVEGMENDVLIDALIHSGITASGDAQQSDEAFLTKQRLYRLGLCGKNNSSGKRKMLLQALDLPERMSTNEMISFINITMNEDSFYHLCDAIGIIDTESDLM